MEIISMEAKDYFALQLMKDEFNLSASQLYTEVLSEVNTLEQKLNKNRLSYIDFKSALLPVKDKKKKDYVFVFDTTKIKNGWYGYEVFEKIIPCFSKNSKHSVLSGDLLNLLKEKNINSILKMMFKALEKPIINEPRFTNRFYLVYITNISIIDINNIIREMSKEDYFIGSCDMTFTSVFKSYISHCIGTTFIKLGENIIMGHEPDIEENSDRNMCGYPFEENGYNIISIQGDYFSQFLSYAIDSDIILDSKEQEKYLNILSNVITKDEISLDKSLLNIKPDKIQYLDENKKIFSRLKIVPEDLNKIIVDKIKKSNIYNISFEHKDKEIIKFNIFFDYSVENKFKKIVCALGYNMETRELHVITMY